MRNLDLPTRIAAHKQSLQTSEWEDLRVATERLEPLNREPLYDDEWRQAMDGFNAAHQRWVDRRREIFARSSRGRLRSRGGK
jgi:hypothetical protein